MVVGGGLLSPLSPPFCLSFSLCLLFGHEQGKTWGLPGWR